MKTHELIEMVRRVSLLKGFTSALAIDGTATVFARGDGADIGHGRLEEAIETVVGESTEACARMTIGDFVRAEIDVEGGHVYVAVAARTRLIALFDTTARESAVTGKMDDIFEHYTGAIAQ